jgi:cytochrome oxidase Cu insertion factor (SCO1/SenC/PrrC family)
MKALVATLLLFFASFAQANDFRKAGQKYFTDVELVNQKGEKVRFYSDLIDGRIVIINSFFATCTGVCPVMGGTFKKIQAALGDRIGKDVHLISISVDPENDTPAALRKYAKAANARPGWTFITGDRKNVEAALHKLGLKTENKESHTPVVLIGNEPKGIWKKAFGLAASDEVVKLVNEVVAAQ